MKRNWHTRAPWKFVGVPNGEDTYENDFQIVGADGYSLIEGSTTCEDPRENAANVFLIEAAPELLASLEQLMRLAEERTWPSEATTQAAQAAIDKARGKL